MRDKISSNVGLSSGWTETCRRQALSWINYRHWGLDARRMGGGMNTYVDRYESPLILAVVITLIGSVLDAHFTLQLMDRGAVELNLLMAYLMEDDHSIFIQLKVALTALSMIFLVVHKNFQLVRRFRVGHLIYCIAVFYVGLVGYELFLLNTVA